MRGARWQRGCNLMLRLQLSGMLEPFRPQVISLRGVNEVSALHACALLLVGELHLLTVTFMADDGGHFSFMRQLRALCGLKAG